MVAAVCGGFLFLGGVLALGLASFGNSVLFLILGLACTIAGLANIINELYYYYKATYRKIEREGDSKDDA